MDVMSSEGRSELCRLLFSRLQVKLIDARRLAPCCSQAGADYVIFEEEPKKKILFHVILNRHLLFRYQEISWPFQILWVALYL